MFSQTKHQIEFQYFHTFMQALRCEDFAEKCYFGYSEVKVRILNQRTVPDIRNSITITALS